MPTHATRKSITDMMDSEEIKIKEILQIYLCKTNPVQIGALGVTQFLLNIFAFLLDSTCREILLRDTACNLLHPLWFLCGKVKKCTSILHCNVLKNRIPRS